MVTNSVQMTSWFDISLIFFAYTVGLYMGVKPAIKQVIYDTLMEDSKWSIARLMIFFTFWSNILYAGWCVYKTAVFVDLPTNWLALIGILYGMIRGATAFVNSKTTPSTVTTSSSTKTEVS
jgi:hypothetical protein